MIARQLPDRGEVFLDHLAHFVPSLDCAATTLEKLGFRLTPFAAQQNRTADGTEPSGMANRCVMFHEGYLEFLTAVSQTELARQFQAATARYIGLHLVALSVGGWKAAHAQLARSGFRPNDPVNLTRPVEDEDGKLCEARFTVLRVPPETMPEGRIQLLEHHTPDAVWQPRWLAHANGIVSLKAVLIAVADPEATAVRFGRFAGRAAVQREGYRWTLELDRGVCSFVQHDALPRVAPFLAAPMAAPWIAGYALGSADPALTRDHFTAAGLEGQNVKPGETAYRLPPELGGFAAVVPAGATVSWAT